MLLDDKKPPPDRHGYPRPSTTASVGVGGAQDRPIHWWYFRGSVILFLINQGRQGRPVTGGIIRTGYPCISGASILQSIPHPWFFRAYDPVCWRVCKGTTPSLVVLCPGRNLFNRQEALLLPGVAPGVKTPPSGRDPSGLFFGTVRHPLRDADWPPQILGVSTPDWLSVDALQAGGEDDTRKLWYGLPGDDPCAPDSAAHLLVDPGLNIDSVNKFFSPLLSGQALAFEEMLDRIKFAFAWYRMEAYMATKVIPPIRTTIM